MVSFMLSLSYSVVDRIEVEKLGKVRETLADPVPVQGAQTHPKSPTLILAFSPAYQHNAGTDPK